MSGNRTEIIESAKDSYVAIVPQAKRQAIARLDNTVSSAAEELKHADSDIMRAVATAYGMSKVLEALTPDVLSDLCRLQGTKLGFRTDKDHQQGYTPEQLKPVIAEALLRGLQVIGNHINIISGNLYVTREGFEYLLSRLPGLTDLKIQIGVPSMANGGALVPAKASWKYDGVRDEIVCEDDYRIPIKVNNAMGVDAIRGKAASKVLRQIYSRITGSALSADGDEVEVVEVPAE